jgi:predicted transcriptional regulator of viral defense system
MEEYPSRIKKDQSLESKIDERILGILKDGGPLFFSEIIAKLSNESFREILLSWSRLREKGKIEQIMDGKYSLSTSR